MTWTWNATELQDPTNGPLMQVRSLIGDVDTTDQLVQDEEITAWISLQGGVLPAAITIAEGLGARFARDISFSFPNDVSQTATNRSQQFFARAAQLRRSLLTGITPYAGGISRIEKEADLENDDILHPWSEKLVETERPGIWNNDNEIETSLDYGR